MRRLIKSMLLLALVLSLSACWQTEQQKAALTEKKRIECLDKICEGDVVPEQKPGVAILKLNGQWYEGPREYFSNGISGAAFWWWNHRPLSRGMEFPAELKALIAAGKDDFSIPIFLRYQKSEQKIQPSPYDQLLQAKADGRLISKATARPGLEIWRINEPGVSIEYVWYVAADFVNIDPAGAVMTCRNDGMPDSVCTSGFIWRPGISAYMRFHGRHAQDWPEIYQEVTRILQLIKKV